MFVVLVESSEYMVGAFSVSVLNGPHVLDALESVVIFVFNNSLALPISSDDLVVGQYSGHLEGEEIDVWLYRCFGHGILADMV